MNLENKTIIFDNKEFQVLGVEFSPSKTVVSIKAKDLITSRIHLISTPTSSIQVK